MKAAVQLFISVACIILSACSTQHTKQDNITATTGEKTVAGDDGMLSMDTRKPPMTVTKNGIALNLVRVMDGAACKNAFEGAKGTFLVYAAPQDIERIKREQGTKVFSNFETKIQDFSGDALQQAVNATNLSNDPFSLGEDAAQQKIAEQLSRNFQLAVADPISAFEKETTLTVDIRTYIPSFEFYQQGCKVNMDESENPAINDGDTGNY